MIAVLRQNLPVRRDRIHAVAPGPDRMNAVAANGQQGHTPRQAHANGDPAQAKAARARRGSLTPPRGGRGQRPAPSAVASLFLRLFAVVLKLALGKLSALVRHVEWFRLRSLDYVPRPDDIFIVTYPRSGTTWMQMILYQLTTEGSMDIPHIAQCSPWFERSLKAGKGFDALPSPRIFKSHLSYRQIPKGPCKYIYVARNGKDVAVSYFHLYQSHNGYKGTFEEFFDLFLCGKVEFGSWFQHVRGWWRRRDDPNVLFLHYEDLLGDLEGCLRKIIAFCGFEIPPERFPSILERCSFSFMKKHEMQFDHLTGTLWEQGLQFNAFLRQGKAGSWKEQLDGRQEARFDRVYHKHLGPARVAFGP